MSEDKSGKAKITVEVEVNEALMAAAKELSQRWVGWVHGLEWVPGEVTP